MIERAENIKQKINTIRENIRDVIYSLKVLDWFIKENDSNYKDFLINLIKGIMGDIEPIRRQAEKRGQKPAVIWEGGTRSHKELFERAEALAKFLTENGVSQKDKIALISPNTPEAPEIWLASNLIRAHFIPVNYRLKSQEIKYIMENSECQIVIYHEEVEEEVKKSGKYKIELEIKESKKEMSSYEKAIEEGLKSEIRIKIPPASKSKMIIYTSGTTGKPKGAYRPLKALNAFLFIATAGYEFGISKNDRHLVVCPLYHSAPLFFAQLHLTLGATIIIEKKFRVERFVKAVSEHKATTTFVVPYIISEILEHLPEIKKDELKSLRKVICGGAFLSPHLKRRFSEEFGPILYEFYGSTETSINSILKPYDIPKKAESVGKIYPLTKIKIIDEDGNECPPNKIGEIFVKSPFMMRGYYKDEEYTKQWVRDGFISAGDIGKIDEDGYLYITDRKKDMIISGGVNIYPAEIESALYEHPAVKLCAVVGVPDEKWGERVKAFIVLKKGFSITEKELEEFLRSKIAGYKIPREWEFVDELPITPSGKILKRELRKTQEKIR